MVLEIELCPHAQEARPPYQAGLVYTFITDTSLDKLTCLMDRQVLCRGQGSEGDLGPWFHRASGITCQVFRGRTAMALLH